MIGLAGTVTGLAQGAVSGILDTAARIAEARDPEAQRIATQARADHRAAMDRRGLLALREQLALDLAHARVMATTGGPVRRRRGSERAKAIEGTIGEVDAEIASGN